MGWQDSSDDSDNNDVSRFLTATVVFKPPSMYWVNIHNITHTCSNQSTGPLYSKLAFHALQMQYANYSIDVLHVNNVIIYIILIIL